MTTTTLPSPGKPQGVSLPGDVEEFLQMISECFGRRDREQIMRHVSDDFLYQGMNKEALGIRLKKSHLFQYLEWMKITILHFQKEANMAELAGFAETNLGVMPAAGSLLPLLEGSRLIKESDGWKLLGNLSKTTMGLYNVFQQISAYFVPIDLSLYRSLLPAQFEVPREPMVFVKGADYQRARLPVGPHKSAHVQILAEYEKQQGWYTLTMPEDEWLPVEMGKTIGYPKFVADSMVFDKSTRGWAVEVVSEGDNALSLSLQFEEDHSQANGFERISSKPPLILLRKILPGYKEKPWFLMMPLKSKDLEGQTVILRGEPILTGLPQIREAFGTVRLSLKTNQPWSGLFPSEVMTKGVFFKFAGELMLRHSPIAVARE